jgi:dienelactone hydrolase
MLLLYNEDLKAKVLTFVEHFNLQGRNDMATRRLFSMLILGVLLAGCTGQSPRPPAMPAQVAILAPTAAPTAVPTAVATAVPTARPTAVPTAAPTVAPTATPTALPTAAPTATPTTAPTATPIAAPSPTPTPAPTATATAGPILAQAQPEGGGPGGPGGSDGRGTPGPTTTAIPVDQYPQSIPVERARSYPGSEITFEQTLAPGANYARYIVSYRSDGLKIYALMTVPNGPKPATGWPVVIFNHGHIPPTQYVTTERYVAYQDAFARAGYISFKSDYRGHGKSEGRAQSSFSSADYTTDVLNALASLKAYKDADPNRIGMWGHSMGGQVTLRAMVISKDIKAGVIWAGTVASVVYEMTHPRNPATGPTPTPGAFSARGGRGQMLAQYGTPDQNPAFWNSLSPNSYLADLSGPLQLHHGAADTTVPPVYSDQLLAEVKAVDKPVELYTYPGDNHNISNQFNTAMARSVAFMDKYVKGL